MSKMIDQSKSFLLLARKDNKAFGYLSPVKGQRIEFSDAVYASHECESVEEVITTAATNGYKIAAEALKDTLESVTKTINPDATDEEVDAIAMRVLNQCNQAGIVSDPETIEAKG